VYVVSRWEIKIVVVRRGVLRCAALIAVRRIIVVVHCCYENGGAGIVHCETSSEFQAVSLCKQVRSQFWFSFKKKKKK
jgi:hypothetical protein